MKRMRILVICVLILLNLHVFAQKDSLIIGKWYVDKVVVMEDAVPKDEVKMFNDLVAAFSKCSFTFGKGGEFSFDFPYKEMQIPKGKWSFDPDHHSIKVTEAKDTNSSLMGIIIENKPNGEIYFLLEETPFKLKMKKYN